MIGKSLIGIYDNRLWSSTDRQKSVSKIWLVIGKGLDRRLRDRQKSKGKSLIGVCVIGKNLETTTNNIKNMKFLKEKAWKFEFGAKSYECFPEI